MSWYTAVCKRLNNIELIEISPLFVETLLNNPIIMIIDIILFLHYNLIPWWNHDNESSLCRNISKQSLEISLNSWLQMVRQLPKNSILDICMNLNGFNSSFHFLCLSQFSHHKHNNKHHLPNIITEALDLIKNKNAFIDNL